MFDHTWLNYIATGMVGFVLGLVACRTYMKVRYPYTFNMIKEKIHERLKRGK